MCFWNLITSFEGIIDRKTSLQITTLTRNGLGGSIASSERYAMMPLHMNTQPAIAMDRIDAAVEEVLASTAFIDIHTHLFSPALGPLGLWGIDELLTYHYLEAELFRFSSITPDQYWNLSKTQRADLIWKTLFVEN